MIDFYKDILKNIEDNSPSNAEELSYIVYTILDIYKNKRYPDYNATNSVLGVLEDVKFKFYLNNIVGK